MKCCLFRSCKNFSKSKNIDGSGIFFVPVPKPSGNIGRCKAWLKITKRSDITPERVNKSHYVCSKHFVGEAGPTEEFPDPLPLPEEPAKKRFIHYDHSYNLGFDSVEIKENNVVSNGVNTTHPKIVKVFAVKPHLEDQSTLNPSDYAFYYPSQHDVGKIKTEVSDVENYQEETTTDNCNFNEAFVDENDINQTTCDVPRSDFLDGTTSNFEDEEISFAVSPSNLTCREASPSSSELEILAKDYLSYQAADLRSYSWNLNIDKCGLKIVGLTFVEQIKDIIPIKIKLSLSLSIDVLVYNERLSDEHPLYNGGKLTFGTYVESLDDLLKITRELRNWTACEGVKGDLLGHFKNKRKKTIYYCKYSDAIRATRCRLLFQSHQTKLCVECRRAKKNCRKRIKIAKEVSQQPCQTNRGPIRNRLAALRTKNLTLNRRIKCLEAKIRKYELNA